MAHNEVGVSDFVKERLLRIRGDLRIFKDLDPVAPSEERRRLAALFRPLRPPRPA